MIYIVRFVFISLEKTTAKNFSKGVPFSSKSVKNPKEVINL